MFSIIFCRIITPRNRIDRHDAHEQFIEKFLDPQRSRIEDLDRVPTKELKSQDVTRMDGLETQVKVKIIVSTLNFKSQVL